MSGWVIFIYKLQTRFESFPLIVFFFKSCFSWDTIQDSQNNDILMLFSVYFNTSWTDKSVFSLVPPVDVIMTMENIAGDACDEMSCARGGE